MTYHGTNTYIVDTADGTLVIDPGPAEDSAHFDAILENLGDNPAGILVTHHHSDHFGAAPALRERTGLPIHVSSAFPDDAFEADRLLHDGETVGGLVVLHTPGHSSDHLCFARPDGILFSGDHVMSWNSSIVNPPDGDMHDYCAQLQRLIEREDEVYLPGHGPVLRDPRPYVERLLANRMRREAEILVHIQATPDTIPNIASTVYRKSDPHIAMAAERNVLAHLEKLLAEQRVVRDGDRWGIALENFT
ncbi:MBL fold metallo-hydrolase [Sulfitobacter sp. HI0129]|nr:MBL fold metallo-hydrolase [Sulfitobacter sp. HI0023]KZZ67819.1 MBL fold metallo-hydrolase [Sulfitobacter sp. HI0129]